MVVQHHQHDQSPPGMFAIKQCGHYHCTWSWITSITTAYIFTSFGLLLAIRTIITPYIRLAGDFLYGFFIMTDLTLIRKFSARQGWFLGIAMSMKRRLFIMTERHWCSGSEPLMHDAYEPSGTQMGTNRFGSKGYLTYCDIFKRLALIRKSKGNNTL